MKNLICVLRSIILVFILFMLGGQINAEEKTLHQQTEKIIRQSTGPQMKQKQVEPQVQMQMNSQQAIEARILEKLKASISFPSPQYDSGWLKRSEINILETETTELTHNVGGNVDRYFVDIQIKYADPKLGISNQNIGGANGHYLVDYCKLRSQYEKSGCVHTRAAYPDFRNIKGAYYSKLTNKSIGLRIYPGSDGRSSLGAIESIRVRIWAY
ncbi:MAG: hypothetical protein JXI33_03805 [Candidatus Aminicenantes bacterium]|nr:hypothetical protein [Candidatus Aminicenantes bacterium]